MQQNYGGSRGFTLLELLVVLGIILLLTAVAVPMVDNYLAQAKVAKAQTDIEAFRSAFNLFRLDVGGLPSCPGCNPMAMGYCTCLAGLPGSNTQGINSNGTIDGALNSSMFPNNIIGWKGPYMTTQILKDPWDMWYQYEKDDCNECSTHNFSMIWSIGPNRMNEVWDETSNDGTARGDDIFALMKGRL